MRYDYLIVGQGLAGSVLAYSLIEYGASVLVISDENSPCHSRVAGGMFNPVTGKRTVKTWKADVLFPFLKDFYLSFEKKLNTKIAHFMPVYKPFASYEEQNQWLSQSALNAYEGFVNADVKAEKYNRYLSSEYGGFETLHSGYIDVNLFIDKMKDYLLEKEVFLNTKIDTGDIVHSSDHVQWKDYLFKKIIFCDGIQAMNNHFFHWLPFTPSKGETLNIKTREHGLGAIISKSVFVIPLNQGLCRIGSTYQWKYDTELPTQRGKAELLEKLDSFYKQEYEVTTGHFSGIRPAIKDRRPVIGLHPEFDKIGIFNGLGTKGVSIAPYWADQFCKYLQEGAALDSEVSIERFYSIYYKGIG